MNELILFSITYGFAEWELLREAKTTGPKVIFGIFSRYHLYMFILFLVVSFPMLEYIPMMLLIEDISYRIARKKWVQKDEWLARWGMISFVPLAYVYLIIIQGGLLWMRLKIL